VFSFVPRCQGEPDSQKLTFMSVAMVKARCSDISAPCQRENSHPRKASTSARHRRAETYTVNCDEPVIPLVYTPQRQQVGDAVAGDPDDVRVGRTVFMIYCHPVEDEPVPVEELDYRSYVDHAIAFTSRRLPNVDPVTMRLGLALRRLSSALVYDLESTVHRPRGWSWSGFRVLVVLWTTGPVAVHTVAQLSGMGRAAVSSVLLTLERNGLVSKLPSAADRRVIEVDLSSAGRRAVSSAYPAHNQRERVLVASLTSQEQRTLTRLLEKLLHGTAAADAKTRF
jgi:DNA-binding MarR family transcriptional regulator